MRNLKKFLALVLAMMMALSLMVTVNAATTNFTDEGNIDSKYLEAVSVLNALKVIKGRGSSTNMEPKSDITRGEFATILYRLVTGDVNNEKQSAYAGWGNFTDTTPGAYYDGALDYIQKEGIMQGSNGKFYPDLPISGIDATVALLRAVGIGRNGGYSGSDYGYYALVDAEKYGLTNVVTLKNLTKSATTREIIAQMVFNALTFVPADKDGNPGKPAKHYVAGGKEFGSASEAESFYGTSLDRIQDIEQHTYYPNSLAELRFGYLHVSEESHDKFHRPTVAWVQGTDGKETTLIASVQKADYTYNIEGYDILTGKIAKTLQRNILKNSTDAFTVYYNGVEVSDPNSPNWCQNNEITTKYGAATTGLWVDDNNGIPGLEVYIYGTDVVVCEAYLAKVGKAAKTDADIDVAVYEVGANSVVTITGYGKTPSTGYTFVIDKTLETYETVAAHQGEYMAIYVRPEFSNKAQWAAATPALVNEDDVILDIVPMTGEKIHIAERTVKHARYDSYIRTLDSKQYRFNNEAVLLKGYTETPTAFLQNMLAGVNPMIDLGLTTMYRHNGYILLLDQTSPTPTVNSWHVGGYAYFYDVKRIEDNGTDDSYVWESDGGKNPGLADSVYFHGRLLLAELNKGAEGFEPTLVDPAVVALSDGLKTKLGVAGTGEALYTSTYNAFVDMLGTLVYYTYDANSRVYTIRECFPGTMIGGANYTAGTAKTELDNDGGIHNTVRFETGYGKLEITENKSEGKVPNTVSLNDTTKDDSLNVAFDSKTVFIVVTTAPPGQGTTKSNFKATAQIFDIYNVPGDLLKEDTAIVTAVVDCLDADGYDIKDAGGTYLVDDTYKIADGKQDNTTTTPIARVVLIVDKGSQTIEKSNDVYFIVRDPEAPQTKMYRDETLPEGTAAGQLDNPANIIWYYEYQAVINNSVQDTIMIEVDAAKWLHIDRFVCDPFGPAGKYGQDNATADVGYALRTNVTFEPFPRKDGSVVQVLTLNRAKASTLIDNELEIRFTGVTEFGNDHIKLTGVTDRALAQVSDGREDYLIEPACKYAYAYDREKGTVTQIELAKLTIKDFTGTGKYAGKGGLAVRNTSHTLVTGLFLDMTDIPVNPDP